MFKMIFMVKKRPDISREAFIDFYDNQHVPMMRELTKGKGVSVHRRNYIVRNDPPDPAVTGPDDGFDAITELLYASREAADEAARMFADPELLRQSKEDQAKFLLPAETRRYIVEVHQTVYDELPGFSA